jgi:uncharacterized membrane protein YeiH
MGFFATAGAALAVDNGASWFAAALLGTLSAIAGSTVRDVLAARTDQVIDVSLGSQTRVANAWAAKSAAWSAIPLVL